MRVIETALPDVKVLEPAVFADDRGFFLETYNRRVLNEAGIVADFVQDNHSRSTANVVRGLHYQVRQPQGKLVRVVSGEILDIAVDIRRASSTFGRWVSIVLSAENKLIAWVPPGFAHGFAVRSACADVIYKATDYYAPEWERTLAWDDPQIGVDWQLSGPPIVSNKDQHGIPLHHAEVFD